MASYRCWLCPRRVWVSLPAPAGASDDRHERIAVDGYERHYAREHGRARP